jgi:hypothetical protein
MTKIYKTFKCDAMYPIKTWNEARKQFSELEFCEQIPDLGQIINEDQNVNISFHVYELNNC